MDKKDAIMAAQQYVDLVRAEYPLVRALVFGSYAKGVHHADSDIDVAVVLKNVDNLFDAQVALMRLRSDDDLMIEPHVFREKDFTTDNPFAYEVLLSGEELRV
ncbi:MAG: nucleotidyltransferase domain-containing protein [Prevotellaceae bacterium]|jgi:predicted nucleotidyltransferase|nr:nucleotidyltransferase domain-containing protein [Prevotellaceae bacterium]